MQTTKMGSIKKSSKRVMINPIDNWYLKQVIGLSIIIKEHGDTMISSTYVNEKLSQIISGDGISFHPLLDKPIESSFENGRKNGSI